MRCPKCSYLSYDDVERCRNCGYDFSLAATPRETEAPIPVDPTREPRAWEPTRRRRPMSMDTPAPTEGGPLDLPLFDEAAGPEPPPVVIPPAGPPLSVRRKVETSRPPPMRMDAIGDADDPPASSPAFDWPDEPAPAAPQVRPEPAAGTAIQPSDGLAARVRAGAIDAVVLGSIDLLVLWLTLRVAGVTVDEWRLLPVVPLLGFLFLLDTAYLVTFTAASGQTIGKMASKLRVVYGDHGRVPFGHAVLRAVALLLCVIPAGLGLLPLFMDTERRGAHDRLAGTRVVPAD